MRMKMKLGLAVMVVVAFIGSVALGGQGGTSVKQVWEYKHFGVIVIGTSTSYLEDGQPTTLSGAVGAAIFQKVSSLGREGWEMTGIAAIPGGTAYWFKRPR